MPYRKRSAVTGQVVHVFNRSVRRQTLFELTDDYRVFLRTLTEARALVDMRLLAYCVMPNHFHLLLWPREHGELSRFMQWLLATHSKRWHARRGSFGTGSVYQGRFKSIPVQSDAHFLIVSRYVERNALRAGLVSRAADWAWSSGAQRRRKDIIPPLYPWPILPPADWDDRLNEPQRESETDRVRRCIARGTPFGDGEWTVRMAGSFSHPDADLQKT